ncbi:unnamed protein product [Ixodes pacificus]
MRIHFLERGGVLTTRGEFGTVGVSSNADMWSGVYSSTKIFDLTLIVNVHVLLLPPPPPLPAFIASKFLGRFSRQWCIWDGFLGRHSPGAGSCGGVESRGLWALILDKQSLSRKWLDDTLGTKIV